MFSTKPQIIAQRSCETFFGMGISCIVVRKNLFIFGCCHYLPRWGNGKAWTLLEKNWGLHGCDICDRRIYWIFRSCVPIIWRIFFECNSELCVSLSACSYALEKLVRVPRYCHHVDNDFFPHRVCPQFHWDDYLEPHWNHSPDVRRDCLHQSFSSTQQSLQWAHIWVLLFPR